MSLAGFVRSVGAPDGQTLFVRCEADQDHHHHHAVCVGCGGVECLACPVEAAAPETRAPAGFRVTGHEFRVFGLCRECSDPEDDRS
jgi:Fe2+ or Zn2+ uptake regulation protein